MRSLATESLQLRPARFGGFGFLLAGNIDEFATVNPAEICPVFRKNLLRSIRVSKSVSVMCSSILPQPGEVCDGQATVRWGKSKFSPWISLTRRRACWLREIDPIESAAPSYRYFGAVESVSTRIKGRSFRNVRARQGKLSEPGPRLQPIPRA
jgi:hypothetical protein